MNINYNVTGSDRKRLVAIITRETGIRGKYEGMPSMAYTVGGFRVDKAGSLTWDETVDTATVRRITEALAAAGFEAEGEIDLPEEKPVEPKDEPCTGTDTAQEEQGNGLTISLPKDGFTPESFDRLVKLVDSKADLIRKALGAQTLDILQTENRVEFPWWGRTPEPEETQAYMDFIANLCALAKGAKRVNTTSGHAVESEKFAFRVWLLRLGFNGAEYKATRAVLLKNLSGPAAFPNQEAADAFSAAQKAKRTAAGEGTAQEAND